MKKPKPRGTTLTDADIRGEKQFGRRSFLRLTGAAVVGASALVLGGSPARSRHTDEADSDPRDTADADPRRHRSDEADSDTSTTGDPVDEDSNSGVSDSGGPRQPVTRWTKIAIQSPIAGERQERPVKPARERLDGSPRWIVTGGRILPTPTWREPRTRRMQTRIALLPKKSANCRGARFSASSAN